MLVLCIHSIHILKMELNLTISRRIQWFVCQNPYCKLFNKEQSASFSKHEIMNLWVIYKSKQYESNHAIGSRKRWELHQMIPKYNIKDAEWTAGEYKNPIRCSWFFWCWTWDMHLLKYNNILTFSFFYSNQILMWMSLNTHLRKIKLWFGKKKSAGNNTGIYVDMKQKYGNCILWVLNKTQNVYISWSAHETKKWFWQLKC